MILHNNPFSRDKDQYAPLLLKERWLMGLFAATAVVGTFSPVVFTQQPNASKLIQQLWGLFASSCFTAAAFTRKQKEKDYQAISNANHKIVTEHLRGQLVYHHAIETIESQRGLAEYINTLPEHERVRWMQAYSLHGLVELPQVQQAVIEAPARLKSSSIPSPNIADVNEDAVQEIINPDVMAQLQALASQYPKYIRIDDAWIDELCESASLHNMSDRSNHHFIVAGESQSGKSTLVGVIINKVAAYSQKPAIVVGSDPKDQVTRWLCKFSRKFDGMAELGNWITFATDIVSKRQREIGKNNGKTNDIAEIFFVQDEVDTCYGEGKGFPGRVTKDTANDLQALWNFIAKFTGGLKCHGIFVCQSPLSEATGFSRPNLKNLCFLALGKVSGYVLANPKGFFNVSAEVVELLRGVCELLDESGVRYCLVIPTRGKPYIAIIPKFDIDGLEQKHDNQQDEQPSDSCQDTQDWLNTINKLPSDWYQEMQDWLMSINRLPSEGEVRDKWQDLTGQELNQMGIQMLMENLGLTP